jgi:cytochrome o ubiquinol oxidase subunit 2
MTKRRIAVVAGIFVVGLGLLGLVRYLRSHTFAVLQPKGIIAHQEYQLILFTLGLGLFVVLPVLVMTFSIAWKYREGNAHATYSPEWDHSVVAETAWWGIPIIIIAILSVVTWNSSHALDPSKPLASNGSQAITIQVVALPWKWLFIYPNSKIATVNYVQIPVNTPVNFQITSDAPMNSFWIPQLGGQIYAMSGMTTQLHLEASEVGSYNGSSANISGVGFSGMKFVAEAVPAGDFAVWTSTIARSTGVLNSMSYAQLAKPSQNNLPAAYALAEPKLYNQIMNKYMSHSDQPTMTSGMSQMSGMTQ